MLRTEDDADTDDDNDVCHDDDGRSFYKSHSRFATYPLRCSRRIHTGVPEMASRSDPRGAFAICGILCHAVLTLNLSCGHKSGRTQL